MPTYDYECGACDHSFELFQQMSDSVKRKCPACGKLKLKRLIGTGAGIIFKGGGFYETDYRTDSYKKAAEADKKSSSADQGKSDSKKDGNTDGKTDGKKNNAAASTKKTDDKSSTKNNSSGKSSD